MLRTVRDADPGAECLVRNVAAAVGALGGTGESGGQSWADRADRQAVPEQKEAAEITELPGGVPRHVRRTPLFCARRVAVRNKNFAF